MPILNSHIGQAWPVHLAAYLSMAVAFAVRDAVTAGLIEPASDPTLRAGPATGGRSAMSKLFTGCSRRLGKRRPQPHVSLVFIDSALWSRMTPTAHGLTRDVGGARTSAVHGKVRHRLMSAKLRD
ncbi:hypothetical protein LMTR3_08235 [Bradyrhizobium sp. LMTR 3]|nr:hypothetical protein LMTR3_08235 [Bradyrhizobium sp. LMTR 3]